MATISPTWTENQTGVTSTSITACITASGQIDIASLGYDMISMQVAIDIGSSSGATIYFYSSPDSGTTFDTTAIASYTVSADDTRSIVIAGIPFVECRIVNNDGVNDITDVTALYAGRKWNSA